jgi:hypothetical protein
MPYRYRIHRYTDREAPLNAGRPLSGRTAADAIAEAEVLWEGAYAAAHGCCVVDTEDGNILWRRERERP